MRRSAAVSLLLVGHCLAVAPVWKTPVAERRFAPPLKRSSAPYYTRPEDFQIPNYQAPRPNNPPVPRLPITPPGFRPNYNLYPRPHGPQGPFPPPHFPQQQRQPYPQAYQPRPPPPPQGRFPNGWIYWNGAIVPPEAIPYLQGAGPVPPQGAYGPAPSTRPVTIPAVRPDTFTGSLPMAPSAQPELYTQAPTSPRIPETSVPYEVPTTTEQRPSPTTTVAERQTTTTTEAVTTSRVLPTTQRTTTTTEEDEEATMGTLFTMRKNPFVVVTEATPLTRAETPGTTRQTTVEHEGGYQLETEGTKPPPNPPSVSPPQPTAPVNLAPPPGTPQEEVTIDYFPRPVQAQAFQPPPPKKEETGQEIVEKLDVKVLQPTKCSGPLCFDKNKVSVYTPPKGPKLLISNAAKGENGFFARPSVPEQKYLPYAPGVGGPPPRPLEHPRGPHVFIPPNAFSVPPYGYEVATTPYPEAPPTPYSATARTYPPTDTYEATPPSAQPPFAPSITPPHPDVIPFVPNYGGGFLPKETSPPSIFTLTPPPGTRPPPLLATEVPPSGEITEETEFIPFVPSTSAGTIPPWAASTTESPSSYSPTYKPLFPETTPERPTPASQTSPPARLPSTQPTPPHPTLVPGTESPPPRTPPVIHQTEGVPPEKYVTPTSPETPPPPAPGTPPGPGETPQTPPTIPPWATPGTPETPSPRTQPTPPPWATPGVPETPPPTQPQIPAERTPPPSTPPTLPPWATPGVPGTPPPTQPQIPPEWTHPPETPVPGTPPTPRRPEETPPPRTPPPQTPPTFPTRFTPGIPETPPSRFTPPEQTPPTRVPQFETSPPRETQPPQTPPTRFPPPQTPETPPPSRFTPPQTPPQQTPPSRFTPPQTPPPRIPPGETPPPRTPPPSQTPPGATPPIRTPPPGFPSVQTPPPGFRPTPPPLQTTSPRLPGTSTPYYFNETTPSIYQSTTPKKGVQNRLRSGKVRVICQEDGIKFIATSILPFSGEIFANDRKRIPACFHSYENVIMPMAFLPFNECGVKNAGDQGTNQTQYHMQVVVVVKQQDGSTTVQSYMAQCVHQKIHYDKQSLPRRIEEALEELRLVPTKIEQKALLPLVEMKLLVDEHGRIGPEVAAVDIGMPLAVHWKLTNESAAYGFHVKNCAVADMISGIDMPIVDEQGCSTDTTILAHPHYDTYHDSAASHMWAFKVPDNTRLRLSCEVSICTDISSSESNQTSCSNIPTPPFCPDLITSPANSILFDTGGNFLKRRRDIDREAETQTVRAAICTSANCRRDYVALPHCVDTRWLAASSAFSVSLLALSVLVNMGLRWKVAHEKQLVQSGRF